MANTQLSSNLVEITTPRQANNGTRMFCDMATNCYYGSYASGYVRRIYVVRFNDNIGPARLSSKKCMYPLNPRATISSGSYKSTICVMINNEDDRIEMINKAANSNWSYSGNYKA